MGCGASTESFNRDEETYEQFLSRRSAREFDKMSDYERSVYYAHCQMGYGHGQFVKQIKYLTNL